MDGVSGVNGAGASAGVPGHSNEAPRLVERKVFFERLARFEERLWSVAPAQLDLGDHDPPLRLVAERVLDLSDLYTLDRVTLARAAAHAGHRMARVLYFLCSDAPKVRLVLEELADNHGRLPLDARRWSDVGCGCGATSVGFILSLALGNDEQAGSARTPPAAHATSDTPPGGAVHVHLVDTDRASLEAARLALELAGEVIGTAVRIETHETDLLSYVPPPDGSPILCQSALNELPCADPRTTHRDDDDGESDRRLVDIVHGWSRERWTILIEPALRVTTRPLHRLRDRVLERGVVRVVAPCPHQHACPMLATPKHWCHEVRRLPVAPMVDAVQRLTKRRDERTKYSFTVLAPGLAPTTATTSISVDVSHGQGGHPTAEPSMPLEGRIVSDPIVTRGKTERVICTTGGALVQLRLLDRERTEANGALATLERGRLVTITGEAALPRVGPGAAVHTTLARASGA